MDEKSVVAFCMGAAFIIVGCVLSASEKVAAWGLSHGAHGSGLSYWATNVP